MWRSLILVSCLLGCSTAITPAPADGGADLSVPADLTATVDLAITPLPDLASNADLTPPPITGCHGLLLCNAGCKGIMGCPKTCLMNTTAKGQMVFRALSVCLDLVCPTGKGTDGGMPADGGGAAGDGGAVGDGGDLPVCAMQNSPACKACHTAATAMGGSCVAEQAACDKDLP